MRSIVLNFMLFEQQSLMMKFMLELMYSITKFTSSAVHSERERCIGEKTSQELRMLSSVTINCEVTKIVMNSGSQLSEL